MNHETVASGCGLISCAAHATFLEPWIACPPLRQAAQYSTADINPIENSGQRSFTRYTAPLKLPFLTTRLLTLSGGYNSIPAFPWSIKAKSQNPLPPYWDFNVRSPSHQATVLSTRRQGYSAQMSRALFYMHWYGLQIKWGEKKNIIIILLNSLTSWTIGSQPSWDCPQPGSWETLGRLPNRVSLAFSMATKVYTIPERIDYWWGWREELIRRTQNQARIQDTAWTCLVKKGWEWSEV
jgi:hypothetical protein